MTDHPNMKPPPRLLDDPAVAPEVQQGLSELAATQLPFDTAAGLSAFESALGSATQASTATTTASVASSTGGLIAGGVALLIAGAGMYAWLAPSPKAASPAAAAPRSAPEIAPAPPAEPVPQPVVAPEGPIAAPIKGLRQGPPAPAATPLDREVELVVKAKALVHDKPRAALTLLQRLEREHPEGALSEERAGLRVLALWAAGDLERARTERAAFLARYPQSPMRERLAQLAEPQ